MRRWIGWRWLLFWFLKKRLREDKYFNRIIFELSPMDYRFWEFSISPSLSLLNICHSLHSMPNDSINWLVNSTKSSFIIVIIVVLSTITQNRTISAQLNKLFATLFARYCFGNWWQQTAAAAHKKVLALILTENWLTKWKFAELEIIRIIKIRNIVNLARERERVRCSFTFNPNQK